MTRFIVRVSLLTLVGFLNGTCLVYSYTWTSEEQGKVDASSSATSETLSVPLDPECQEPTCENFRLHFFQSDKEEGRKTILYIPGGPGYIVNRKRPDLGFLEKDHNVVYFHVRGSGFSRIPSENTYDRYLRAKFVSNDIEAIRKRVLGDKPWDAIYAHSHGTVIAQHYAQTVLKSSQPSETEDDRPVVSKLILSAPPSRHKGVNLDKRRSMIIENLLEIFERNSTPEGQCRNDKPHPVADNRDPEGTDDFCFVTRKQMESIRCKLGEVLMRLEEDYGLLAFVVQNYDTLAQTTHFKENYPDGKSFFVALRHLERIGWYPYPHDSDERNSQISAAYVVGYGTLEQAEPRRQNCTDATGRCCMNAAFVSGIENRKDRSRYCERLREALYHMQPSSFPMSRRNFQVFGLYDGLNTSVVKQLDKDSDNACETAAAIAESIVEGRNEVVATEVAKIFTGGEKICAWDPATLSHEVPTLILAWGADPLTSRDQVERVFCRSLKGPRVEFAIPGAGHVGYVHNSAVPALASTIIQANPVLKLINKFMELSLGDFVKDSAVEKIRESLGARMVHESGADSREGNRMCELSVSGGS